MYDLSISIDFKSDNGNKYFVQPEAHCYKLNVKSGDTVNIHRIMIRLDNKLKDILNNKKELQDMILSIFTEEMTKII